MSTITALEVAELVTRLSDCQMAQMQLAAEIVGLRAAMRSVLHPQIGSDCAATLLHCRQSAEDALNATPHALVRELLAAWELAEDIHERCEDGLIMNNPGFVRVYEAYRAAKVPA